MTILTEPARLRRGVMQVRVLELVTFTLLQDNSAIVTVAPDTKLVPVRVMRVFE